MPDTMPQTPRTLSTGQLADVLDSETLHAVIDVRERGEYILGHIPGAVSIPRGLLEPRLPKLVPSFHVPVVLYCDDAHRSRLAAATAEALGYTDVTFLAEGLDGWREDGREISYGVNVVGKEYGERIAVQRAIRQVTPAELDTLRSTGEVLILDVRTPGEFEDEGHLEGAHNVPGSEIVPAVCAQLSREEPPSAIVLNCAGRTRSLVATDLLASAGFRNVHALENGTMAWLLAGRALATGPDPAPLPQAGPPSRQAAASIAHRLASEAGIPSMLQEELADAIGSRGPLYVLDVRSPEEFQRERISGAVSCPAGQLTNYLDDTIAVRRAPIVCYSGGDTRSIFAARTLRGIGYPDVRWLEGGLDLWRRSALPTAAGPDGADEIHPPVDDVERLTPADIDADGSPRIIDIRQSSAFMAGHVPGSVWVPRGDLERRIEGAAGRSEPIVVVSDQEYLAGMAARTLTHLGFRKVRILGGGIDAWSATGNPLAEGADGSDIDLLAAREEADLVGHGPVELQRTEEDMRRYLHWEERLGDKYAATAPRP